LVGVGQQPSAADSPDSSVLSDLPQQPTKKRRVSTSSLSAADNEDDDDDEEEDQPLAARMTMASRSVPGKRSGKQPPGKKSKKSHAGANGIDISTNDDRPTNGRLNGINGHETRVKMEDKMDEGQLSRLTAGVPVDAVGRSSAGVCISLNSDSLVTENVILSHQ